MDSYAKWKIDRYFEALADVETCKAEIYDSVKRLSGSELEETIEYLQQKLLQFKRMDELTNSSSDTLFNRFLKMGF